MKRTSKTLLLVLCAVLLVTASVMGTMAYLTATATVENAFTVGKVEFGEDGKGALDEAKVNEYGEKLNTAGNVAKDDETLAARVDKNTYKLIPGHEYIKDPTIHIAAGSEACYVFVKVDNDIEAIEDKTDKGNTIAAQMKAEGWTEFAGTDVYYKEKPVTTEATKNTDVVIFRTFKLANDAPVSNYANAKIFITAYAVQADGFDNAQAAWKATFGPTVTPSLFS